jgi:hypothetical protein
MEQFSAESLVNDIFSQEAKGVAIDDLLLGHLEFDHLHESRRAISWWSGVESVRLSISTYGKPVNKKQKIALLELSMLDIAKIIKAQDKAILAVLNEYIGYVDEGMSVKDVAGELIPKTVYIDSGGEISILFDSKTADPEHGFALSFGRKVSSTPELVSQDEVL